MIITYNSLFNIEYPIESGSYKYSMVYASSNTKY